MKTELLILLDDLEKWFEKSEDKELYTRISKLKEYFERITLYGYNPIEGKSQLLFLLK